MAVSPDEKRLIETAQQGGPNARHAFHTLVEGCQQSIYAHCLGMLHNPDDAMDVTQEAFTKAYRNLPAFTGAASFKHWVRVIATHACIDFIRRTKRVQMSEFDEDTTLDEDGESAAMLQPNSLGISPAKVLARKELADQIRNALGTLSEQHRQILLLRELDGLSYEEIAEAIEVPIGTVMSRLHHARKNMQRALESYLGGKTRFA